MSGLLGSLLSYGNTLRQRARGLMGDPVGYTREALANALPTQAELVAKGPLPQEVDPRIMDLGLGLLGAIKVYHGSPHKFTKASSEHIGKGEGAQAYGHGLYWAESKGVAEDYAKRLDPSRWDFTYTVGGKPVTPRDKDWLLAQMIGDKGKDVAIAEQRKQIAEAIQKVGTDNKVVKVKERVLQQMLDFPDVVKTGKLKGESNVYEASLRWPDPAREAADPLSAKHFLDWDKPLSEQPEAIKQSLKGLSNVSDEQVKTLFLEAMGGKTGIRGNPATAGDLYRALANYQGWNSGDRISAFTGEYVGSAQGAVSKYLKDKGIPGITYLDAGSRAAGTGTRNYVTFSDDLIELLKRNGVGLMGE